MVEVSVVPEAVKLDGADGAVVSAGASVVTSTHAVCELSFHAASYADTV